MRVVSLVPSLTESAIGLGLGPDEVLGRTAFCISPADIVAGIKVVGGTKTPSLRRVLALRPDVVLVDRDENRLEDAQALEAAGVPLFVADVAGPLSVPALLRGLGSAIGRSGAGESAAAILETTLRDLASQRGGDAPRGRAAILVWRDPWIAVAPDRYAAGMLRALGYDIPRLGDGPYPRVTLEDLAVASLDLIALPDEPYAFGASDAQELSFVSPRVLLGHGQDLLWYGTRTAPALHRLSGDSRPR